MFIKRLISFIFSLLIVFSHPFGKVDFTVPVTVEGAIFGGESGDRINTGLNFDYKWVTAASNKKYNSNLAAFSALLCADSYYRAKDLAKGTQNRVLSGSDEYTQTALLEKLGYTDVRFVETFRQKTYTADSNDSATLTVGYKNIDGKFDSYIFVLRGCFSIQERLSIFDIGADTEQYTALTGEHTEWTDTDCFKGLSVAANRAQEFIDGYMQEHDNEKCPDTVLVTGHSRGADIAEIIGAGFEDNKEVKSYTYAFNSMPVTECANAAEYRTIFNIFDTNDYYANPLPFKNVAFYRYGRELSLDISGNEDVKNAISTLKGRNDYTALSAEKKTEYDRIFAERFPDRSSLYNMSAVTEAFETREEALSRLEEINTLVGSSGLNVADFCKVGEIEQTESGYSLTFNWCGAALLNGFAEIQAYGAPAYEAFVSLFSADASGCRAAKLLNDNLTAVNSGHLLINTYILSGYFTKNCRIKIK